jgi:hypothetical protein
MLLSLTRTAVHARLDLYPLRESMQLDTSAMLAEAGLKQPAEVTPIRHDSRQAAATP